MSKHKPISDALRGDIKTGKYPANSRLPSEEALCRRWHVSRPTIARALRDLQLEGLIERRAGSGTYVHGEIQPLHTIIGLLVDGLGKTEIMDPICAEITKAAQQRNCSIITGGLPKDCSPAQLAAQWAASGVRGVVFAPMENIEERQNFNMEVVKNLHAAGIAVVLLDRDATDFPRRSDLDLVEMDNFHAGYELGRHLVTVGTRKVIFVARPSYPSSTDQRLAGVAEALRRHGLPAPEFLVGEPDDPNLVRRLNSDPKACVACICSNDLTAAKLLQTANALDYQIPGDFLLAGFDDVGFASLLSVPLTTIRQPCRAIGIACVDTLLGRMAHPGLPARAILLRGELVMRKSTTKN
ncbi:MAG TPA: GntR family transcriptional regulator [Verrucomicrobiae bacterium]|jgi:LacI family transcriptional regulator